MDLFREGMPMAHLRRIGWPISSAYNASVQFGASWNYADWKDALSIPAMTIFGEHVFYYIYQLSELRVLGDPMLPDISIMVWRGFNGLAFSQSALPLASSSESL
mmetsp:Transcript_11659/g.28048  ORF Transcript_11659/g.28048 Transcript_11659/m.28048 type:complete len:104 (-) Transcript_11659:996-1307(-)